MQTKFVALIAAAGGSLALLAYDFWAETPQSTVIVRQHEALVPSAMNIFAPKVPALGASEPVLTRLGLTEQRPLTKQQQYDRLKNGTAEDRMKAYQIVKACIEPEAIWEGNRQLGITIPRPDTVANCGDLTPGTTQNDEERRALLIPAAKAGIKGAFASLMQMEGPDGFMARMGHPPIPEAEWDQLMTEAKEAGKVTADPDAMEVHMARVTNNPSATPDDKARAVEYAVAAYIKRYDGNVPYPVEEFVSESPRVQALIKGLPPGVAQKAIAAGRVPRPLEFKK